MSTITSSVGLISGINTGSIITALINADSIPVNLLKTRVASGTNLSGAYASLGTQVSALQDAAKSLEKPDTFTAAAATSSDPSVLTATAANGAALGNYSLQVARLVTTQQLVGAGFADATGAKVGAGTITIDQGGGLATETPLSGLNGGAGVGRGKFRVTDRSGATATIDTSSAVSLDDVVNAINNADTISVRASVKNDKLVLTDSTGQTASDLIVQDLGTGTSAADLGIAGDAASAALTGTSINYLSRSTGLSQLNDGRGVGTVSGADDLQFTLRDGSTFKVSLTTAQSVGDVLDAIGNASGGKLTATVAKGSTGITLTDTSGGAGTSKIENVGASTAATDLGLAGSSAGASRTGGPVLAGLDTTLLSSLKGGAGIALGGVQFTDRSGRASTLNFSGDSTVQDVLDRINNDTAIGLKASIDSAGTGIQIADTTGGTGQLRVADVGGGTTAAALGLAGTFDAATPVAAGANLHKQWVTDTTLLSKLNGGKGIAATKFTISATDGKSATVDLSGAGVSTVKDLLYQINSKAIGVTASINANGNGILLTDTTGGAAKLSVTDVNGTAAADLNLAGVAIAATVDGAYEKTLAVTANDTLTTVAQSINNLGFGVSASVISDGSPTDPFRLSLTAKNSGTAGAVSFDAGGTNLGTEQLVKAQDAAVFIGGSTAGQPLLVTSTTNQVTNVIHGVTINLVGVGTGPVQLAVTANADTLAKTLGTFVDTFNSLASNISAQSQFNSSSNTGGLLLGNSVSEQITAGLYTALNTVFASGSKFRVLADIGITVGDGAKVSFDESKFRQAFAQDSTAVGQLFSASTTTTALNGSSTTVNTGLAYAFDKVFTGLDDPVSGTITSAVKELAAENQGFTDQITRLNALLDQKKTQLETEFANMENVLAGLQSQQAALGSISTIKVPTTSTSSTSGG